MGKSRSRSVVRTAEVRLRPLVARQVVVLALVAGAFWLLRERLPLFDVSEIWRTARQVAPLQWIAAAAATAGSFWAVGRYDSVMHGLLGTGVSTPRARAAGTAAIAIAQFAGFGVLSGALARWRLLGELSLGQSLRLSVAVSLSFLAGWAVLTAVFIFASGINIPHAGTVSTVVLVAATGTVLLAVAPSRSRRHVPSLRAVFTIITFTLIDTFFAGLALYLLVPAGVSIPPMLGFTAFLIALGAGLVAGTPGGVGPFELTLIALLPMVAHEQLLASALAFRVIYYLVPATLGALVLVTGWLPMRSATNRSGPQALLTAPPRHPYLGPALEAALWFGTRAETNLVRQGEFSFICAGSAEPMAIAAPAGQSMVMLGDPLGLGAPKRRATIKALVHCARRLHLSPLIYKCSARTAAIARKSGWRTLAIAQEAWLAPGSFSPDGPQYRQLRRLLRKAEKAGVRIVEGGRALPVAQMERVAREWAQAHGGERGFSMGRFQKEYVSCQRVFLAYRQDRLVGFVTFHENYREWTLDLMRHGTNAPDGTMHLLLLNAINSAAAIFCPRLCLAALPLRLQDRATGLQERLHNWGTRRLGGDGLRRFKTSFAPNFETVYAAAPTRFALIHGLLSVLIRVNRPAGTARIFARTAAGATEPAGRHT